MFQGVSLASEGRRGSSGDSGPWAPIRRKQRPLPPLPPELWRVILSFMDPETRVRFSSTSQRNRGLYVAQMQNYTLSERVRAAKGDTSCFGTQLLGQSIKPPNPRPVPSNRLYVLCLEWFPTDPVFFCFFLEGRGHLTLICSNPHIRARIFSQVATQLNLAIVGPMLGTQCTMHSPHPPIT